MNPNSGELFITEQAVEQAKYRGEPLIGLTPEQAQMLANMNRRERRKWAREHLAELRVQALQAQEPEQEA